MEIGNKYDNVVDFEKTNAIDSNSSISSMYANDSSNEKNLLDNMIDKGFDKLDDKINDFVDKVADAMSNFNNADSDLAQANKDISDAKKDASSDSAHDIKEEYAKGKIDDFAKNSLGITDDKTREEFVNFTYENNKELIQSSNSLELLDNNITKVEVNAKEDFANNLDRKEEALNGLKNDKDVDKDALNKELNDVKSMKDNLDSDKEKNSDKDVEKDVEKDSDKSSEKGADKEKSQDADIAMSR